MNIKDHLFYKKYVKCGVNFTKQDLNKKILSLENEIKLLKKTNEELNHILFVTKYDAGFIKDIKIEDNNVYIRSADNSCIQYHFKYIECNNNTFELCLNNRVMCDYVIRSKQKAYNFFLNMLKCGIYYIPQKLNFDFKTNIK